MGPFEVELVVAHIFSYLTVEKSRELMFLNKLIYSFALKNPELWYILEINVDKLKRNDPRLAMAKVVKLKGSILKWPLGSCLEKVRLVHSVRLGYGVQIVTKRLSACNGSKIDPGFTYRELDVDCNFTGDNGMPLTYLKVHNFYPYKGRFPDLPLTLEVLKIHSFSKVRVRQLFMAISKLPKLKKLKVIGTLLAYYEGTRLNEMPIIINVETYITDNYTSGPAGVVIVWPKLHTLRLLKPNHRLWINGLRYRMPNIQKVIIKSGALTGGSRSVIDDGIQIIETDY